MQQAVSPKRIEINYAGVQGMFWLSNLCYNGFTAVLLSYKGFTNAQIGLTSGILCVLSIAFQLFTSSFSDLHQNVPLKRIIQTLLILAMACAALLLILPPTIPLLIFLFALGGSFQSTNVGLINAQIMQYINAGLPVNFGWPRGTGSIIYATAAFILGRLMEIYSPALLLPCFLVFAFMSIFIVGLMPTPAAHVMPYVQEKNSAHTSTGQMLKSNVPLALFLLASITLYMGQTPASLFLLRVITNAGGSSKELGMAMLLQSGVEMPIMFLTPLLIKKVKVRHMLVFAFLMYIVKNGLILMSGGLSTIYIAMASSIFCYGIYGVCSSYFVNDIVKSGEKVRAQSLIILASNLGNILGNLMAGIVLDSVGLRPLLIISLGIVILAFALMFTCSVWQDKIEKA